jgi:hypothetical protein
MWLKLLQKHLPTHVYCSTIHNSQAMETAKKLHDWWIDQENVVFIYNGILLSHNDEWNFVISNKWMELENIILSAVSQAQKAPNHLFSLICGLCI